MEELFRNVRHAVRQLGRSPGLTAVVTLTLGLGIGANTVLFHLVNGVLLRPLPFEESERLAALTRIGEREADLSIPDARDLRDSSSTLESLALFMPYWAFDLTGEGEPERIAGSVVEPDWFDVLRADAVIGRTLRREDNVPGAERVAVIGEGLWRRRFSGSADVLGQLVTFSDHPYRIVGVVPSSLDLLERGVEIWVPVAVETPWALEERGTNNFEAIARLAPGAGFEEAEAEILTITRRLAAAHPATNRTKILVPMALRELLVGPVRPALLILLGGVGLVLLVACVNVASLLLLRAAARGREVSIRLALGAGRARILRQLGTESLLLAVLGGGAGIVIAIWVKDALLGLAPAEIPRLDEVSLDARVLGFAAGLTVLTGALFGLLPALHVVRSGMEALPRASGSSSSASPERQTFLSAIAAAEIAFSFVLLIGAALLLRSFIALQNVELGFRPGGVITANVVLPESRYAEPSRQTQAFRRMVEALEALPDVERAAFVIGAPLTDFGAIGHSLLFDDRPPPDPSEQPSARNRPVLGDYFRTMGIRILRGRGIDSGDDAGAPAVAVVNESFARRFWPDRDPLGRRVAWQPVEGDPRWMTVVGVASDVKTSSLAAGDEPAIYTSYLQREEPWQRFGILVARGRTDATGLARPIREAVWSVDPTLPLDGVATLEERLRGAVAQERFNSLALALFGLAALMIALQGVYGVLSHGVSQRRAEIGVRMAMGARPADIARLILRRGAALAGIGMATGALVALAASRWIASLLYGVGATDAIAYAVVTAVLLVSVAAASYFPARRATRIDPVDALRCE